MKYPSTISRAWIIPLLALVAGCYGPSGQFGRAWIGAVYNPRDYKGTPDVRIPANARSISNLYYRYTGPDKGAPKEHLGIDIIAPRGTPIIAPADGRVARVFSNVLYGNNIIIDHGPGKDGRRIATQYKHLQKTMVSVGQFVRRGDQIGALGNTGVLAGGLLHLHFEVQLETPTGRLEPVDPNVYWSDGAGLVTCFDPSKTLPERPFRIIYPVVCGAHTP